MALQKQSVPINFAQGIETKVDPKQVPTGKFLSLKNTVFDVGNLLKKRNGFNELTTLDAANLNTLNTHQDNLTAIGNNLYSYSADSMEWINKGKIESVDLSVTPLVRSSSAQQTVDVASTTLGLVCTVWQDSDGTSKYQIVDSTNGQIIISQTTLPSGAVFPRVFLLGRFFVITFLRTITATVHLQYLAIPINNLDTPGTATDISTQVKLISSAYDGQIVGGQLYLAWDGSDAARAVRITYLDTNLNQHLTTTIATKDARVISICGDESQVSPIIYLTFTNAANNTFTDTYTSSLIAVLSSTQILTGVITTNLTSHATSGICKVFYATNQTYNFSAVRSDYMSSVTVTSLGVVGTPGVLIRSVTLASKAFSVGDIRYMLVAYGGTYQPTYFLMDESGNVVLKLAYANGGGYPSTQVLSNAIVSGTTVKFGYLFKAQLTALNKEQTGSIGGLYSQTGINLANVIIGDSVMTTAEIGGSLHFASGFLWMYDGVKPVEHGFHVYPEDIVATTATTGGSLTAQIYFHQVTYEWTDAKGNIHRSAPSIPIETDISGSMTSTNKITLKIPTLRTTYKVAPNSVRIVIYRWSTGQQNYYQVTSITSPTLNDPSIDNITYVDTQADTAIVGNELIYTTGGVVENIAAPPCKSLALYKSRLFLLSAEDDNIAWFSKQVIENTPVETSDLFTIFIAPTTGSQGSTGPCRVISAMDDKVIFFKDNALYYVSGNGPDNTGANNDFSDPVFITATAGCDNPQSVTFMPQGIMFQSDKGIWLLSRDLSTSYIGSPVQAFNDDTVTSALTIPGTNQVRFTLDSNTTLVYDYFYGQWGEFEGLPSISSVIYNGEHTILNSYGQILQETANTYLDGSNPVLVSFKTGWMNLAGLQGFERAYFFYLLGQYLSPHKIRIEIAYDYNSSPSQSLVITPDNYSPPWGGDSLWGSSSPWGGPSQVEQWRIFFQRQKCQAFQLTISEIFDSSLGVAAGAGFTLSGLNLIVGAKSGYPRLDPSHSAS
jgi:hypothetical protein